MCGVPFGSNFFIFVNSPAVWLRKFPRARKVLGAGAASITGPLYYWKCTFKHFWNLRKYTVKNKKRRRVAVMLSSVSLSPSFEQVIKCCSGSSLNTFLQQLKDIGFQPILLSLFFFLAFVFFFRAHFFLISTWKLTFVGIYSSFAAARFSCRASISRYIIRSWAYFISIGVKPSLYMSS